jgi:N-methylhydantoinase A
VAALTREGQRRLDRPASSTVALAVDCRYEGQGYELTVPLAAPTDDAMADAADAFHRVHDGVFGHSAPEEPVETVAIRVTVTAPGASFTPSTIAGPIDEPPSPTTVRKVFDGQGWKDTPVFDRRGLGAGWAAGGPLVIAEGEATSWVPAGWRVETDAFGTMRATREAGVRA